MSVNWLNLEGDCTIDIKMFGGLGDRTKTFFSR